MDDNPIILHENEIKEQLLQSPQSPPQDQQQQLPSPKLNARLDHLFQAAQIRNSRNPLPVLCEENENVK